MCIRDSLATVLYNLVEGICIGASLLKSFMPRTTERILVQLNANERTLEELSLIHILNIKTKNPC